MYAIYKNNKRFGSKRFDSYEAARSYARKLARQGKFGMTAAWDPSDSIYHNPSLSLYGVSINKI